jgi:hypothetical protein
MKTVRALLLMGVMLMSPVWGGQGGAGPAPQEATSVASSDGVLALHATLAGSYVPWFTTSFADDGVMTNIGRLRGDEFSKFYYLVIGDKMEVRTEEGVLIARIAGDEDIFGVRKTPTSSVLIQYYAAGDIPPHYDLTVIKRGRAWVYRCRLDPSTLEAMTGRRDMGQRGPVGDSSGAVVRSLEEADPALARDHCVAIGNGVRRGRDMVPKPVLTQPFPHLGDRIFVDERGLKGGWIYAGMDQFGPARRHCCAFTFEGDGQVALVITGEGARGGYPVRQIIYVDKFVRSSMRCEIDGEQAVIAVADADWKNGRAYLTDGRAVRIVRWADRAPPGCPAN